MDGDFRRLAEEFQTLVQGFADLDASLAIDAQDEARMLAARLDADLGGTEILKALAGVVVQELVPGLPRQLVVLTDGQVTNTDEVIALVRSYLK